MESRNNVQINLSIPERYRNLLRRIAAERIMENPGQVVTGASLATELLLTALKAVAGETIEEGETKK